MARERDAKLLVLSFLMFITFGTMIGLAIRQSKINEDGVEQAALAVINLQHRLEEMSDSEKEQFCYEVMRKEVYGESGNETLNQLPTKYVEYLDDLTRRMYFETIPAAILDYWPKWFQAVVPDAELSKRWIIFHEVPETVTQKHFLGELSYWTAVIHGEKISIEHYVSENEAVLFAQVLMPVDKNLELKGIMQGGYLILQDENETQYVLTGERKIEELTVWQKENSSLPISWVMD